MDKNVRMACSVVRAGGLIAYPTEGVFGVGCDPSNAQALRRLLQLKKRDPLKGFILIASDTHMLSPYVRSFSSRVSKRVLPSWPGPVTWVVAAAENVPVLLTGGRSTLAVRVTAHPFVCKLCNTLGHALVSTSANRSGAPPLKDLKELQQTLGGEVDYIVPMEPGELKKPTPIFDAETGKQLR